MMALPRIKVKEAVERRYLGALRLVDLVTGRTVRRSMILSAVGMTFFGNAAGLHVIARAGGLDRHSTAFEHPPGAPTVGTIDFTLRIQDPLGEYLERTATVSLPRDPDPQRPHTVFKAIDVHLFPSPRAYLSLNWSVIRASVFDAGDMDARNPLPGALLRVVDGQGALMMSGMSDLRGEAVVVVPGIPISRFAGATDAPENADAEEDGPWLATGAVVETQTPAAVEVIVRPETSWPVDPQELEDKRDLWRRSFKEKQGDEFADKRDLALKTGRMQHFEMFVDMSNAP